MAEIIEEPSALSKIIPVSFKINDTDSVATTRLATKKQFNTTDTDAWLSFTLDGIDANMTGEFDLTMVNVDENPSSIINRTNLPFSAIPFHYKIDASADVEKNQIRHAGRWIGQVIIRLANGDTTTRQFDFAIVGHLLDGKEARLILIEDYNALMATITTSKDELAQYNIDYAALIETVTTQEAARVQAELTRVQTFDALVESEMIAQNVATKLTEKEATYAPRLLSAEQQLEQKVDSGEVRVSDINKNYGLFDETYISDTLKSQIAGTTAIGSTPPDASITPTKTTFFKTGKNLFNKDIALFGYRVNELDGTLTAVANYYAVLYIPIEPNTQYTERSGYRLAFSNESKAWIGGLPNAADPSQPRSFTSPPTAKFVSVSTYLNYINDYQLELGGVKTSFESYYQYIPEEFVEAKPFDVDVIPQNVLEQYHTNFVRMGKNLFDKNNVIMDYAVSNVSGELGYNTAYATSYNRPVESETEYTQNKSYYLAYYGENNKPLGGLPNATDTSQPRTFTTPPGCKFIKSTIAKTLLNIYQIEKGTAVTPYESYHEQLVKGLEHLENGIKGTVQSITFNSDGSVQKVQHKVGATVVREDAFTYTTSLVTEVRTLTSGGALTFKYNLDTLETEVI